MYWEVGQYIDPIILGDERAGYGKRIVAELAQLLIFRFALTDDKKPLRCCRH